MAGCGALLTVAACTEGAEAATGVLDTAGLFTGLVDTAGSLGGLTISSGPGLDAADVVVLVLFFATVVGFAVAAATFLALTSEAARAAAFFSYFALRVCGHFLPVAIWHG